MDKEDSKEMTVGDSMPDFMFDTPYKKGITLEEALNGKKTMFLFLRYYGCTVCQVGMYYIKEEFEKIQATGGQIKVVLQSDPQLMVKQLEGDNALPYDIICDPKGELYKMLNIKSASNKLGLAGAITIKKGMEAKKLGFTHGEYEGDELQLPAAFVVEVDKKISYAYYGKSAADVPEVEEIIELLK